MSFLELLKELARVYSIPLKELIDDFMKHTGHSGAEPVSYYHKMIKKLEKEIQERLKLKKIFEEKLKEEQFRQKAYEEAFNDAHQRHSHTHHSRRDEKLARYYACLEVPYGSDLETVKKAYKTLLKKYHPDFYGHDPEKQKTANLLTQKLSEAYQELEKALKKP